MKKLFWILLLINISCQQKVQTVIEEWLPYDEADELIENASHDIKRMQYKLIQSRVLDKNDIWKNVSDQIAYFSEEQYQELKPLILEQNIPTIQSHIKSGKLTYALLTQWYLYRIVKFENNPKSSLHSIIAINPNALKTARERDLSKTENDHPIFGMPILLKDNVNTSEMKTTAGAVALKDNQTDNAFITQQIIDKGGIILGKANLSEWAYFFCSGCPLGYSAVGGQTLNPYGRKKFETGGSSAGSGTTMAANYAAAAIGTETSGSILSPSSLNSIVGLKPTIGLLSRSGIVPISSTLDTPGPMTRNVTDNAILLSAISGEDENDITTKNNPKAIDYFADLNPNYLKGKRFGVFKSYLDDSLYNIAINKIKSLGAECITIEPEAMEFEGFVTFLNADMKADLPIYLEKYADKEIPFESVKDIVDFNLLDTITNAPYGQKLFEGIVEEDIDEEEFTTLKKRFHIQGKNFFDKPIDKHQLDAILSINNYNAGHAAMAKYPCLTVPMGYEKSGQPKGLTFISKPFEEHKLIKLGYAFEQNTEYRQMPKDYN